MAVITGMEKVLRKLNTEIKKIEGRTETGMIRAAIAVRKNAERVPPVTPVEWGNLRASGFIVTKDKVVPGTEGFAGPKGAEVAADTAAVIASEQAIVHSFPYPVLSMGYAASYAAPVHEMTGKVNWKRPGSGPQFLARAFEDERAYILKVIAEEARVK